MEAAVGPGSDSRVSVTFVKRRRLRLGGLQLNHVTIERPRIRLHSLQELRTDALSGVTLRNNDLLEQEHATNDLVDGHTDTSVTVKRPHGPVDLLPINTLPPVVSGPVPSGETSPLFNLDFTYMHGVTLPELSGQLHVPKHARSTSRQASRRTAPPSPSEARGAEGGLRWGWAGGTKSSLVGRELVRASVRLSIRVRVGFVFSLFAFLYPYPFSYSFTHPRTFPIPNGSRFGIVTGIGNAPLASGTLPGLASMAGGATASKRVICLTEILNSYCAH